MILNNLKAVSLSSALVLGAFGAIATLPAPPISQPAVTQSQQQSIIATGSFVTVEPDHLRLCGIKMPIAIAVHQTSLHSKPPKIGGLGGDPKPPRIGGLGGDPKPPKIGGLGGDSKPPRIGGLGGDPIYTFWSMQFDFQAPKL
ncbi:MAG: hypothetical protein ACP5D7_10440 [Limnospira sp.]